MLESEKEVFITYLNVENSAVKTFPALSCFRVCLFVRYAHKVCLVPYHHLEEVPRYFLVVRQT